MYDNSSFCCKSNIGKKWHILYSVCDSYQRVGALAEVMSIMPKLRPADREHILLVPDQRELF